MDRFWERSTNDLLHSPPCQVSEQPLKAGARALKFTPPPLAQAALDAVRQWRCPPTLLNGEPVEVETSIAIIFHLSGEACSRD